MIARTMFQAVMLFIAVSSASAQFVKTMAYSDSGCNTPLHDSYYVIKNPDLPNCGGFISNCNAVGSFYAKSVCLATDPVASVTDKMVLRTYETSDDTCNNGGDYSQAVVTSGGVCVYGAGSGFLRITGCTGGNSVSYSVYPTLDGCNGQMGSIFNADTIGDGKCHTVNGGADNKNACPSGAPVAAPVAGPVAGSTPTANNAPNATPVASNSPTKKSSDASHAVVGFVSVVASLILLA